MAFRECFLYRVFSKLHVKGSQRFYQNDFDIVKPTRTYITFCNKPLYTCIWGIPGIAKVFFSLTKVTDITNLSNKTNDPL